ncbi:hypothetical protein K440DRAFT_277136 [Wilcoxina mikolae CBS 423.85]|nr:hypothetical protein K440DRAFT_277136 [Wilcoxina mikolae CBS 423.85]
MESSTSLPSTSSSSFNTFRSACRQKVKRAIYKGNTTYIYGWIPVLNTIILFLEMAIVAQLVRRYDHYFDTRPILTMMVTNSILNGIADTVAQTVTAVRRRSALSSSTSNTPDKLAIELDEKLPHYGSELIPTHSQHQLPPPFDFERLVRFASWGFVIAPFQFKWLKFLSHTFPLTSSSATVPALKRVAMDQFIFAPVGLTSFFTYMTYAEGGDTRAVKKRLSHVFVPTLKANYMLWPAVQLLNFRVVPLQFQLPFASTVGIAWGTYLSLTNSGADP